jgi:hypothetical protein
VFRYNVTKGIDREAAIAEARTDEPLMPKFVTEFDPYSVDDYNVYDTEYKKVVPLTQLQNRKRLSESEQRIRAAIDVALAADKSIRDAEAAAERERKRLEAEAEKQRLAKEAALRKAKEEKLRKEAEAKLRREQKRQREQQKLKKQEERRKRAKASMEQSSRDSDRDPKSQQ